MRNPPGRAAVLLLIAGAFVLAGCTAGPVVDAPTTARSKADSPKPAPDGSPRSSGSTAEQSIERAKRLGCGEYCQTAGDRGGEGQASDTIVGLSVENPVVAFDDGTIPARIYCFAELDCEGAVLVSGSDTDFGGDGRSDLLVAAGDNRLFAVPLPAAAVEAIQSDKNIDMKVVVDVLPTWERLSPVDQKRFRDFDIFYIVVVGS